MTNDDIKNMIDAASANEPTQFASHFNKAISAIVVDKLDDHRKTVAARMFIPKDKSNENTQTA